MTEIPERLRPFAALGFEIEGSKQSGNQVCGTCPFCNKPEKFYVNIENGMYSCKSGACAKEGNLFTYLRDWYEEIAREPDEVQWAKLVKDRGIPLDTLKASGMRFWANQYYLPISNKEGKIVNFRRYSLGNKLYGLPGVESYIWNIEALSGAGLEEVIYVCEGEWDGICLRDLLDREGYEGVVVGIPGAAVFKDAWISSFAGRNVVFAYDNDADGKKGVRRAYAKLKEAVNSFSWVVWPTVLPDKFDVRDFYTSGGKVEDFAQMVDRFASESEERKDVPKAGIDTRTAYASGTRIPYQNVLALYKDYLHMTEELEWALRIIYAVVLSVQIEGDPLWVHIASVPGSGKTELLASTAESESVHFESSLTPHSLVSGWQGKGDSDPSLIPKLHNKTLVLKDFTEILQMNRSGRDEIYSVLRGAFDGTVRKSYGNGLLREYNSHFNLVTGVTQEIYAAGGASLGERFLIYHQVKGVGFDADKQIYAALNNVSKDDSHRQALRRAAREFLDYKIEKSDIPQLSEDWTRRLVALAQFVAMLRAQVPKTYGGDKLAYRAQHEMGTRIAKQLKKLLLGLSLINWPAEITEDDYRITVRVAMDTCIGFNLEIVSELFKKDGLTLDEISLRANIPLTTARECLSDLEQLGVVYSEKDHKGNPGRPQFKWWLSDVIERHWVNAKLGRDLLVRDIGSVARKHTETTRVMRLKRKGTGDSREYVPGTKQED